MAIINPVSHSLEVPKWELAITFFTVFSYWFEFDNRVRRKNLRKFTKIHIVWHQNILKGRDKHIANLGIFQSSK